MDKKKKIWLWSGIIIAVSGLVYFFIKNSKNKQDTADAVNSISSLSNTEKTVVTNVINKSPVITVTKTNNNTMNTNPATWNVGDPIYALNDNVVATRNDNNGSITGKKDVLMGTLASKKEINGYWVVWIKPQNDNFQYVISAKLVYVKIKQTF